MYQIDNDDGYIRFYFDESYKEICFVTNYPYHEIPKLVSPKRIRDIIYCINCELCDGYGFTIKGIDEGKIYGSGCRECGSKGQYTITEYFLGTLNDI